LMFKGVVTAEPLAATSADQTIAEAGA
jgi:hypothetical protein